MLAILDAIERNVLIPNKIELNDVYVRNKFGEFYKQYNGNEKGYLSAFFIRPYYHLNTAPFYHLVWKEENRPPIKRTYTICKVFSRASFICEVG